MHRKRSNSDYVCNVAAMRATLSVARTIHKRFAPFYTDRCNRLRVNPTFTILLRSFAPVSSFSRKIRYCAQKWNNTDHIAVMRTTTFFSPVNCKVLKRSAPLVATMCTQLNIVERPTLFAPVSSYFMKKKTYWAQRETITTITLQHCSKCARQVFLRYSQHSQTFCAVPRRSLQPCARAWNALWSLSLLQFRLKCQIIY